MVGLTSSVPPSSQGDPDSTPDPRVDRISHEVRCAHAKTKSVKSFSGNFVLLRTVCESCGKILEEENLLMGLERLRCPVDPRLDRCVTSCPVEEGSLGVFENPCLPVRKAMENSGFVAITPFNPTEQESPDE
jgi:hypothetical protein